MPLCVPLKANLANAILGDGNKSSVSYGKRVQLDSLFDARQPMSTVQSLEIQLTPVLNNDQELVSTLVVMIDRQGEALVAIYSRRKRFHRNSH